MTLFLFVASCEQEEIEIESKAISLNQFYKFQKNFNFKHINKSLHLGEDNFQVNWESFEIINFDKKEFSTTYEFDVSLKRESVVKSNLFSNRIIYKLIVNSNNKNSYTFNVIRFEPFISSLNQNPSSIDMSNFDGLKTILNMFGQVNQIDAYKNGEIISSKFNKKALVLTENVSYKEPPVSAVCDNLSFFYDPEACFDSGGVGSGGWSMERTDNFTDWFKKNSGGYYLINGSRYSYTHTRFDGTTYRWVYYPGGFKVQIDSYTPDDYNHSVNDLPNYDGDRIINNLKGKAKCVFRLIQNHNGPLYQKTIGEFVGNSSYILQINSGPCNNSMDEGCTDPQYLDETGLIIINIAYEGYGTIDLASTILHEGIHAEIFRYVNAHQKGLDPQDRKAILDKFFYYKKMYTENVQHQFMADHYVKPIAEALRSLDGNKYPLEDYLGFAWDGLRAYGYDYYYDNGVKKELEKAAYSDRNKKVIDNTEFNKDCNND